MCHPYIPTGIRSIGTGTSEVLSRRGADGAEAPTTSLKDSRVNFRLGTGLQAKVDYRADPAPKIPPPTPPTVTSLSLLITQHALLGDEEAKTECLRLLGNVHSQKQETQKPPMIEYSSKEVESTWTHLEAFA